MKEKDQSILIHLDDLLDTRFATICTRFPKKKKVLDPFDYCSRNHPRLWELIGVSEKEWEQQWDNRDDGSVLIYSRPTSLLLDLRRMISYHYLQGKVSPIHNELTITVNIFPYRLGEAVIDGIVEAVKEWTDEDIEVKIVSLSYEQLTPRYIKENFQSVFLHEWIEWIQYHLKELQEFKIPTVVFYVPGYIIDDNEEYMARANEEGNDPFKQVQRYMSEHLSLVFLTPALFSLPHPDL